MGVSKKGKLKKEIVVLIGGTQTQFYEIEERVAGIFLNTELVWLRTYTDTIEFFLTGLEAKLIFLDSFLPGFSGDSLVSEINKISKKLPIIFISQIVAGSNPNAEITRRFHFGDKASGYLGV
jgi:response regulator of citrate/malate metabolism